MVVIKGVSPVDSDMETRVKLVVGGVIVALGILALFAMTVYPFHYGLMESTILAGAFVVVALIEIVLDNAFDEG